MSNDIFDLKMLTEKLGKLNNSQQSIESLSRWCLSYRKKARPIVETWETMFKSSQKEQRVSFLYLANDILQNSRRKGSEFVNEFWKVLPAALKLVYDKGDESGKKAATRLVDIWEERKVFGSRVQSLKDEIIKIKDPTPQAVNSGLNANPIKIVKKDAQSLRIKLSVGGYPERIVSAFHALHEECTSEESALVQCNDAVLSVERIAKEVENSISQGKLPNVGIVDEMHEQETVLQQCVKQLEGAEATRATLVSLLKDALQDQEAELGNVRGYLQVARCRISEVETLRPKLSPHNHAVPEALVGGPTEPLMMGEFIKPAVHATTSLQMQPSQPVGAETVPVHQIHHPLSQQAASFASFGTTDEESKKAAAAAVAAKLAASASSAQMLSSVLSSLVAEEAASMTGSLRKVGFASSLPMFPSEKRQKLEQTSSGTDITNPEPGSSSFFSAPQQSIPNSSSQGSVQSSMGPPLPPPPPLMSPNQFVQSSGMMMNMMPYGFAGNSLPPPPPPSHLAMGPTNQHNPPPLQPPLQPSQMQNANGGYYRPPGIGPYGSSGQSSTPPVQRQ